MKKMSRISLIIAFLLCLCMLCTGALAQVNSNERIVVTPVDADLPENDELFAAYVEREMYAPIYGEMMPFGTLAGDRLETAGQKVMYHYFKQMFEDIASGKLDSTSFEYDNLAMLHIPKVKYTAADLGVSKIIASDGEKITAEAYDKLAELVDPYTFGNGAVMRALLHDCPYDAYWFDKTETGGMGIGFSYYFGTNGDEEFVQLASVIGYFKVSSDYGSDVTVDTAKTGAVSAFVDNAQKIVDRHASKSDEEKLRAYMDEICNLVSYNEAAVNNGTPYGDPWQLIWVFDEDSTTRVVCEGYAKAFQYLCDLSKFNGNVSCYSVSGVMSGGKGEGRHMWNIVQLNGVNYLVDVTNCDQGTIGHPAELFMVSEVEGKWDEQYTVSLQKDVIYKYDANVISLWGQDVLELGGEVSHTHDWGEAAYNWDTDFSACTAVRRCACGESEEAAAYVTSAQTKAPTCSLLGETTYTAGFNVSWAATQNKTAANIPATNVHSYTVIVEGAEVIATCKTEGSVTKKCATCDATMVELVGLNKQNHEGGTEVKNAVAATCNSNGYTGDTHCLGCGTIIKQGDAIPLFETHQFTTEISRVASTCKSAGSVTKRCAHCSVTTVETLELDFTKHVGGTEVRGVVTPGCGSEGYTGDTYCSDCDSKIKSGSVSPATGAHNYANVSYNWNEDKSACMAEGKCSCGATTAAFAEVSKVTNEAATCGKDGSNAITAVFAESWATTQYETEIVPATGNHVYSNAVYTWAEDFSTCKASHACECGKSETVQAVVKKNETKKATCAAEGEMTYTAEFEAEWAANQTKITVVAMDSANHTGETEVRNAVDVTCETNGYTGDTYCLGCNTRIAYGEAIVTTGAHNYVQPVENTRKPSTCSTKGSVDMRCSGCEATQTQTLKLDPAKHEGETEVRNAKSATCGEDGYTGDTYCLACDSKKDDGTSIPATGAHAFNVEVEGTSVLATCKDEGSVTKKCANCDATEEQTLPVDPENHTGGTYVDGYVAPDCDSEGYSGNVKCSSCNGQVSAGSTLPATEEHDYVQPVETSRVASTCTIKGSINLKCSNCQSQLPTELPLDPANHEGATEVRDAKAATCGEDGYTGDTYCIACDSKKDDGTSIPATGAHAFNVEVEGTSVPATCKDEGSVTKKCANCDATEEQTLPVDPENHTGGTYVDGYVAPDCDSEGYSGNVKCSSCNGQVSAGSTIPATEAHNYVQPVETSRVASTCTIKGSINLKCSNCQSQLPTELPLDPNNHVETIVRGSKASTCGEDGYTGDIYCVACDELLLTGKVLPPTEEHTFSVEVSRVDSTCKTAGSVAMQCSGCTATQPQPLPLDPANHEGETEVRNAKPAACGEDGYTGDTYCVACDSKKADGTSIPATGAHAFNVEVEGTSVPATCKDEGSVTKKCANCDATEEQTLPVDPENHTGGTYVDGYVAPDCDSEGYSGNVKCSSCNGQVSAGSTIPASGDHNYVIPVESTRVPSTCKTQGSVDMKCSGCEATQTQTLELDPASHEGDTEVRNAKSATCGEDGYTGDTYCIACDTKLADGEPIPATEEHTFSVEVSRVDSTCKTKGSVTKKCANCDATDEETLELDPANHEGGTEVRDAVAPDCANDGYTGDTYCLGCDSKLAEGETIPASGDHNYVIPVESTRVPSTCKTQGSVDMKCSGCEATQTQTLELDPANHEGDTEVRNAKSATCGEDGYTGDTYCVACDTKLADGETIPATEEHSDENNDDICDECEKALKHAIEVVSGTEGTANVSSEKTAPGEKVIINVNAGEGYELSVISVRDAEGNAVAFEQREDGSYEFTQPASAVKVTVTFRAVQPELYSLTVVNGTGSGEYEEGASVAIKADEKSGMTFVSWQNSMELTFATGGAQTTEATVVMPAADVTVTAVYEAVEQIKFSLSFNANGGSGVMMPEELPEGEYILLPACQFIAPQGKTFEGWALTPDGEILLGTVLLEDNTQLYAIWKDVQKPVPPVTGDDAHIGLWLSLLLFSGLGAVLMMAQKRKV